MKLKKLQYFYNASMTIEDIKKLITHDESLTLELKEYW